MRADSRSSVNQIGSRPQTEQTQRRAPSVFSKLLYRFSVALLSAASVAPPTLLCAADKETPQRTEAEMMKDLKVPPGFEATIFAVPPEVNYPAALAAAPDGTLYISSDKNGSLDKKPDRGSILRVRDTNGDGKADEVKKFVPNVDGPRGLVWDRDRVYCIHVPNVSAFIDKDHDGVAEETKVLVKGISFSYKDRAADHASNGLTLGIDGWLYLAIGDQGFTEAEGTDGRKLQWRGGGVVRVRPDGTGLEAFSRGTRNIYEVAIDPLLNGFARDNTNDGGGWDIRLHHFSGLETHGYPSLFLNFGDEIVQPLGDYGGGSGCGGLYLDEPGFPAGFGNALYTCDWGTQWIYRHQLTPKGATFAVDQTQFFGIPRVTDLDVDASSRLYAGSWIGSNFTYAGEYVGFIARLTPKDAKPEPLPDFAKAADVALVKLLESPSHRRRLEAQRELIQRGLKGESAQAVGALAGDATKPLATRVAALFALKQALGAKATPLLVKMASDDSIREYVLRALADRLEELEGVPAPLFISALSDKNPRVRLQAVRGLARLGKTEAAGPLAASLGDADPLVAHTAVAALVALKGATACWAVVDSPSAPPAHRAAAFRVLQALVEPSIVEGLIARLGRETDPARRQGLIAALSRLHFTDAPWKGNSWGTHPDTSGPIYEPVVWEQSPKVAAALRDLLTPTANAEEAAFVVAQLNRNKITADEKLGIVLAMAAKNPALLGDAILQLGRSAAIPPEAIPLLIQAATNEKSTPATRLLAIQTIVKTDDAGAWKSLQTALTREAGTKDYKTGQMWEKMRSAFLEAPKLENHHALFEAEAAKLDPATGPWAEAALLKLSTRKSGAPEPRLVAGKALETAWLLPKRRAQILYAAGWINQQDYKDRVIAALSDPDPGVVTAAKAAAERLKIDLKKIGGAPSGPLVSSMKPEAVIAEVLKLKGDAALGEQVFTRAGCVACHTVAAGQTPRGPYLGNIAATYKRQELAESILLPNKSIAQGFASVTFTLKDGRTIAGFVSSEAADKITVRNIAGEEMSVPVAQIVTRNKLETSMMPAGLANTLTIQEFASLLSYLEALAKK